MAAHSYQISGIVLRKTKLGETDLIVTLLAQDGAQVKGVAKGARKPSSSFASRLELFSVVEAHCAGGRSLDVIKEVRFIEANDHIRRTYECAVGAAPMVELLEKVTQAGLANPSLFPLTQTALRVMQEADEGQVYSITAAHLLKTLAFVGLKPSFDFCVTCGASVPLESNGSMLNFSYPEGGVVCKECAGTEETVTVLTETCRWAHALLMSPFKDIITFETDVKTSLASLRLCHAWIKEHVGTRMKSLDFIVANEV